MRRILQARAHRPPEQVAGSLRAFDEAVMKCLESTGTELTDRARRQARLGIRSGGVGLCALEEHAPGTYIASVTSVGADSCLEDSIERYNLSVGPSDQMNLVPSP